MHPELEPQNPKPSYCFTGDRPPTSLASWANKPRWVAWEYAWRNEKWTKPPINPRTGGRASVSDPNTWGTFGEALACKERHGLAGIGIVLTGDDLVGGDIDHCISDSGMLTDIAAEALGYGETYAEYSPSGDGIHFLGLGKCERAAAEKSVGIEVYNAGRYFTVTGQQVAETPDCINEAPRTFARLIQVVEEPRAEKKQQSNGQANGDNGHAPASGGDFFARVNAAGLARLDDWWLILFPTARKYPNGALRVSSQDLRRDLEEDLSAHATGITDFGLEMGVTPIDVVMEYGNASDATAAAMWLCKRMGIDPATLGWEQEARSKGLNGHAPHEEVGTAEPGAKSPAPKRTDQDDPPHWTVEPWPEKVSGAELLDEICGILKRYMVLTKYAAEAIALWVLHAWAFDAWEISPLLIVVSPTKQCGKSTLLTILLWILPRSELFTNATASPVFRLIEDAKPTTPTFLFDEGDSYFKPDKEDLRGIINGGWMKITARVMRTDGDGNKRRGRRFSTWAAKVIATIKAVADTLMDRGIIIKMRRATKAEKKAVERFRMRDTKEFATLRQRCLRWSNDHLAELKHADPTLPDELSNRPADNWRNQIAIADLAGGDWGKRARDAAKALSGLAGNEDRSIDLLADIRRVFDGTGRDWLGPEDLVERLVALPETPWAEWRPTGDRKITSRGVAAILKDFSIKSENPGHGARRYNRKDFEEAWQSYLSDREGDLSAASAEVIEKAWKMAKTQGNSECSALAALKRRGWRKCDVLPLLVGFHAGQERYERLLVQPYCITSRYRNRYRASALNVGHW